MQERRKYIRIPESSPISYEIIHDAIIEKFVTEDISQDGIKFFVHEPIPKDTLLKIKLTLKKISFSFETFIRVAWIKKEARCRKYEIGAEFICLPTKATERLIDYIKSVL